MTVRMKMNKTHTPPTEVAVVLGRSAPLARRELELTLARAGHHVAELTVASGVALVKADPTPEKSWFLTLGGATKFGRVLGRCQPTIEAVVGLLVAQPSKVGAAGFSVMELPLDPLDIGRELKQAGAISRYIVPREGTVLSAAQSKGADLEYLLLGVGGEAVVVAIEAVQDIDAFTERDRGLPVADPVRGMLPTKLARMMANIGLGLVPTVEHPVVLDPFCGTGRLLVEAALLGAQILGADIDAAAVDATRQNLSWAAQRFSPAMASFDPEQILTVPIDKLPALLSPGSVDVIITEPYLGPPQRQLPNPAAITKLFGELTPAYEALFRAANHLLTPTGAMVVVFPAIGEHVLLDEMIDRIGDFGYHALDSIRVERPDSIIARVIVTLTRT